jgi:hypothetical protein
MQFTNLPTSVNNQFNQFNQFNFARSDLVVTLIGLTPTRLGEIELIELIVDISASNTPL